MHWGVELICLTCFSWTVLFGKVWGYSRKHCPPMSISPKRHSHRKRSVLLLAAICAAVSRTHVRIPHGLGSHGSTSSAHVSPATYVYRWSPSEFPFNLCYGTFYFLSPGESGHGVLPFILGLYWRKIQRRSHWFQWSLASCHITAYIVLVTALKEHINKK